MFKNIFSYEGRIRRTEYGLSCIISFGLSVFVNAIMTLMEIRVKDAVPIGMFFNIIIGIIFLAPQAAALPRFG